MGDEELYLKATNEVEGDSKDPALWAKAMALTDGDQDKAKYQYIKLRVKQLAKSKPDVQKEYGVHEAKAEAVEQVADIDNASGISGSEVSKEDAKKHDPPAPEATKDSNSTTKVEDDFLLEYVPVSEFARLESMSEKEVIDGIRDGIYVGEIKDNEWFTARGRGGPNQHPESGSLTKVTFLDQRDIGGVGHSGDIGAMPPELAEYLTVGVGNERSFLNLLLIIGLLIPILAVLFVPLVFRDLRKKSLGCFYVLLLPASALGALIVAGTLFAGTLSSTEAIYMATLPYMVFYVILWIHANLILSNYIRLAKQRALDLDKHLACPQPTNTYLERGVLERLITGDKVAALAYLEKGIKHLEDVGPECLIAAGLQFTQRGRLSDAQTCYEKALLSVGGGELRLRIGPLLRYVETRQRLKRPIR